MCTAHGMSSEESIGLLKSALHHQSAKLHRADLENAALKSVVDGGNLLVLNRRLAEALLRMEKWKLLPPCATA